MIPPHQSSHFVAAMDQVLDVYKRQYNKARPVICMDESPKQLIKETQQPVPMSPGFEKKYDYEYARCGVCNVLMVNEPLAGKRYVKITDQKTKNDWAILIREIADNLYGDAEIITLVMDNLATHTAAALY